MKLFNKYMLMSLAVACMMTACKDDDAKEPGNPVMEVQSLPTTIYFGDELPFTVKASDAQVPLSTVRADLYINDELVSSDRVRTKVSGEFYSGKVSVPYLPYMAGTKARLHFTLQNINFTTTEQDVEFYPEYPDFPYVDIEDEAGTLYRLNRTGLYSYAATDNFPSIINGIVIAPAYGERGREIRFGLKGSDIEAGATGRIKFISALPDGAFTIGFNTMTYEYIPTGELSLKFGDNEFEQTEGWAYKGDIYFEDNQTIRPDGFPQLDSWWIDPDYFTLNGDGSMKFNAYHGYYRVIADLDKKYITCKKIDEYGELQALQADGTGSVWVMGTGFGKPNYANYEVKWAPSMMVSFAPIAPQKYRLTLKAGEQISATNFTLRFFNGPGWTTTFTPNRLTLNTDLLRMNVPGKENHNIYLNTGKTLEDGATYEFILDLTAGNDAAVLTVNKK